MPHCLMVCYAIGKCVCVCVLEIKGSRYWTCGIQFRLRKGCLKGFKVV